jgi:signal transduction histidine kinase
MLLQISGWFIVIGSASLLVLLSFFFLLFLQNSRRKFQYEQELQLIQTKFENTLLETQLEIQEQTFTQISQEIHDNIGQVLSLVRLNVKRLSSPENEESINQTDHLLGQAITDLRHLSHNLNSDYLQRAGLMEALSQLLSNLERTGKFSTKFSGYADEIKLRNDATIIIYRIVQEVINNIIKHADATHVSISVDENNGLLYIVVTDNGKGFDAAVVKGGIGLKNILSRAQMIGATVDIKSEVGSGTSVTITTKNNGD